MNFFVHSKVPKRFIKYPNTSIINLVHRLRVYCEHCGETKAELDAKIVEGKLPPCEEAEETSAGNEYEKYLYDLNL